MWDEAKRLRCEWYNDYEKGVTKPPIRVSDLEVVELNFRGDNVDCWMEIQQGKGPWASPVSGIVPLGTTLTMVVGIDDKNGELHGVSHIYCMYIDSMKSLDMVEPREINSFRRGNFLSLRVLRSGRGREEGTTFSGNFFPQFGKLEGENLKRKRNFF